MSMHKGRGLILIPCLENFKSAKSLMSLWGLSDPAADK
jgi:hypothetical protein